MYRYQRGLKKLFEKKISRVCFGMRENTSEHINSNALPDRKTLTYFKHEERCACTFRNLGTECALYCNGRPEYLTSSFRVENKTIRHYCS